MVKNQAISAGLVDFWLESREFAIKKVFLQYEQMFAKIANKCS